MKIPTANLTGLALDWAVAKCEGTLPVSFNDWKQTWPHYSTRWSAGGPIIEREIGNIWKNNKLDQSDPDVWIAASYTKAQDGTLLYYEEGPAPLIAAMRCYVASKLGEEVDIPDELVGNQLPA